MKKRTKRYTQCYVFLILIIHSFSSIYSQSLALKWKVKTSGKIVAGPVVNDRLAFVGNEKGSFMAIEQETGELVWKLETNGNIQAKALLIDNLVFFESANIFYAVEQDKGKEVWTYRLNAPAEKFTYAEKEYYYKLDPFDDKRSTGFLYDGRIYVGCSNGQVIGLNAKTGALEFSIASKEQSPIRSSPKVKNDILYFGDWNGVMYSYDLKKENFIWSKNTYREKRYPTFGGIVSELRLYKKKLFYGARNHMLNVLWLEDGQKEWTYTDPEGGWLIGDPVIFKDTLYMGGSDNFSMLAFNPSDGKLLWKAKRSKNIYGKPIVTEDWVIYGGGHSYDPRVTGELVVLNRLSGETISSYETASSVFSSPVMSKQGSIVFGSNDGTIYALKMEHQKK